MIRINSREVAEIMGKRHDNLMRTIRTDAENYLRDTGDDPVRFYEESTYEDGKGQQRACYEISIEGCERLAKKVSEDKREDFLLRCREAGGERPEPVREVIEYTVKEAAEFLGCSERSIQRYIQSGKLPAVKKKFRQVITGERSVVKAEDLVAFKKERVG